jgi:hypothetical protein
MHRLLIATLACAAAALPAAAQESGGLALAPEALAAGGPRGLARPLPFTFPSITAGDVQKSLKATDRKSQHQQLVARTRGDAGYLGGFSLGQPLSASVQPAPQADGGGGGFWPGRPRRPVIINNTFDGPVVFSRGDGNVIQQQTASGSGPIALQQMSNGQPTPGNLVNVVGPDGNIVQRSGRSTR